MAHCALTLVGFNNEHWEVQIEIYRVMTAETLPRSKQVAQTVQR
jgi:hypothetical protein